VQISALHEAQPKIAAGALGRVARMALVLSLLALAYAVPCGCAGQSAGMPYRSRNPVSHVSPVLEVVAAPRILYRPVTVCRSFQPEHLAYLLVFVG